MCLLLLLTLLCGGCLLCTQNKKSNPERLELMKYNPNLRRHTLHKEVK